MFGVVLLKMEQKHSFHVDTGHKTRLLHHREPSLDNYTLGRNMM